MRAERLINPDLDYAGSSCFKSFINIIIISDALFLAVYYPYDSRKGLLSNIFSFWRDTEVMVFPDHESANVVRGNFITLCFLALGVVFLPSDGLYSWWIWMDVGRTALGNILRLLCLFFSRSAWPDTHECLRIALLASNLFGGFFCSLGWIVYLSGMLMATADDVYFVNLAAFFSVFAIACHGFQTRPLFLHTQRYIIDSRRAHRNAGDDLALVQRDALASPHSLAALSPDHRLPGSWLASARAPPTVYNPPAQPEDHRMDIQVAVLNNKTVRV
jgi:hypothetical protein